MRAAQETQKIIENLLNFLKLVALYSRRALNFFWYYVMPTLMERSFATRFLSCLTCLGAFSLASINVYADDALRLEELLYSVPDIFVTVKFSPDNSYSIYTNGLSTNGLIDKKLVNESFDEMYSEFLFDMAVILSKMEFVQQKTTIIKDETVIATFEKYLPQANEIDPTTIVKLFWDANKNYVVSIDSDTRKPSQTSGFFFSDFLEDAFKAFLGIQVMPRGFFSRLGRLWS